MTYYLADPQKLKEEKEKYVYISNELQKASEKIENTALKLNGIAGRYTGLQNNLQNCRMNISSLKVQADSLHSILIALSKKYEKTEEKIVDNVVKKSHTGSSRTPAETNEGNSKDKKADIKSIGWLSGTIATAGTIGGIKSGGSAAGEILGASYDTKFAAKAQWKQGEDGTWKLKDVGVQASIEGEVHAAKGSVEGHLGYLSGNGSGVVGKVSAKGAVGANLFKDGKISPQIYAEVSAKATVAEGKGEVAFGTENTNAHVKAKGELLTAETKASGQIGKITYENKTGEKTTSTGVKGEIGAEAYIATGSVSGGFTIFGIDIDIGLSGKAGGVGGKIGGYATTGGVQGSLSAGLGLGAGIDISIDWSNFKLGW